MTSLLQIGGTLVSTQACQLALWLPQERLHGGEQKGKRTPRTEDLSFRSPELWNHLHSTSGVSWLQHAVRFGAVVYAAQVQCNSVCSAVVCARMCCAIAEDEWGCSASEEVRLVLDSASKSPLLSFEANLVSGNGLSTGPVLSNVRKGPHWLICAYRRCSTILQISLLPVKVS